MILLPVRPEHEHLVLAPHNVEGFDLVAVFRQRYLLQEVIARPVRIDDAQIGIDGYS